MKKLIYSINLTIDGCCDHTKGIGAEDVHEYFANMMSEFDVLLYGRKTYQLMVPFWPDIAKANSGQTKAMNDFAKAFDAVEKIVVFSNTLKNEENTKVKIVNNDLREEVLKLKAGEGKSIGLGGVDIPNQLMKLDLIDEYRFVIQPLLVGEGRRLLEGINLPENFKLNLVETKTFKSGSVALHYTK